MLKSMTGHGHAVAETEGLNVSAELRLLNGRYFKLNFRPPDGFGWLEQPVEAVIRSRIQRANVNVSLWIHEHRTRPAAQIDEEVLRSYHSALARVATSLGMPSVTNLSDLLPLPGVLVDHQSYVEQDEQVWEVVNIALLAALDQVNEMRQAEGRAMAEDFDQNLARMQLHLSEISDRAPDVVREYQQRLAQRIQQLTQDMATPISAMELGREIAIFADKSDISEEIVRLGSHLQQFQAELIAKDVAGKKLEFLIQEMFRETNTIGAKANDLLISRKVIELKTLIERMREMVQNVE